MAFFGKHLGKKLKTTVDAQEISLMGSNAFGKVT